MIARALLRALCCILCFACVACTGMTQKPGATATTPLALQRVVLYRNGVGYFERSGTVHGERLQLKVRKDQINDLLKSLAVVDSSGQVLGVSLPLDPQSWHKLALSALRPGQGALAQVLDGLRGTQVRVETDERKVDGRIVMVERMQPLPSPEPREGDQAPAYEDWKLTLLDGARMHVVQLSRVRSLTLQDGDIVMQLDRHLDASAGEGMFQQVELTIRLSAASDHQLTLSYVAPAPLWKPTYRIVLDGAKPGQALLQAWAVVDNTSGESWDEVQLSLTSGAPIAFRYDLHTPRDVERVDLSESGVEKHAQVAFGERTFSEEAKPAEPMSAAGGESPMPQAAPEAEMAAGEYGEAAKKSTGMRSRAARGPNAPMPAMAPAPPPPAMTLQALQSSAAAQATAQRIAGLTRFDLPARVTLPDGSATMVPLVNQLVSGEQVFLFKPGGSGQGYEWNPYRVVRFRNDTDFVLEPGPISIYSSGSFVGEGLSEAIGSHEQATIPFAVEPSIVVRSQMQGGSDETRTVKLVRGVLEIESYHRITTLWTVSGNPQPAGYRVLIRHPRFGSDYDLLEPAQGVEKLPDAYFVPIDVAAGAKEASVSVVEQTPSQMSLSIWDGSAVQFLDTLLSATNLDSETRKRLQPIVDKRREIGSIDSEVSSLQSQQGELDQRVEETRSSLHAIQKDPRAAALRKRLGDRLEQFLREADAIGRRIVELQSKRLELKVELEDLLQDKSEAPVSPSAAPSPAKSTPPIKAKTH